MPRPGITYPERQLLRQAAGMDPVTGWMAACTGGRTAHQLPGADQAQCWLGWTTPLLPVAHHQLPRMRHPLPPGVTLSPLALLSEHLAYG